MIEFDRTRSVGARCGWVGRKLSDSDGLDSYIDTIRVKVSEDTYRALSLLQRSTPVRRSSHLAIIATGQQFTSSIEGSKKKVDGLSYQLGLCYSTTPVFDQRENGRGFGAQA